jgi:hypothetical protein
MFNWSIRFPNQKCGCSSPKSSSRHSLMGQFIFDPPGDQSADRSVPDNSDLIDAVRLNLVPGIGPRLQQSLEAAFGSPSAILQASLAELQQVDGIGPKLAAAIVEHRGAEAALCEIERCRQVNTLLLRKGTPEYPRMLAEICDPPRVLYCRGRLEPRDEVAVATAPSTEDNRPSGLPRRSRGRERR